MNMLAVHYGGTEITAAREYENVPRVISKEVRAYYLLDYCVASVSRYNNPATGREVALVLIDRRDAGKPVHEWEYQAIDLYFNFI